jgi:bile acid-coenzyme A ligase
VTDELLSFVQRLRELATEEPDAPAYTHVGLDGSERVVTTTELDRRSSQLAGAMAAKGVGLGDRVGLGLRNSPELFMAAFAAWKLGATPIPVRWDLPDWELEQVREVICARLYLSDDDLGWLRATEDAEVPELPDVVAPRMQGICSSGSTGTPKIIVSSLPAVYTEVFSTPMMEQWRPVPRPQRMLVLAPMYHINAFATVHNLLAGDRLIVLERFDAARAVDAIERHRITAFTATPTMLQRIADLPGIDDRDLSSIDWILQGAAPMPPSLVHRWAGFIGPERILMAYGMTESIGITALRGDEWMAHEGSVGRGQRDTEIRILDDDGNDVPTGTEGTVYMSLAQANFEYKGDKKKTEENRRAGFFTVGDVGYLDDEKYLFLCDRKNDMIISGGVNIYPAEIESVLLAHPKVGDAAVFGIPHADWGEEVKAVIEPAPGAAAGDALREEILAFCADKLAKYKTPKSIDFLDELPRDPNGKLYKRKLRDPYWAGRDRAI